MHRHWQAQILVIISCDDKQIKQLFHMEILLFWSAIVHRRCILPS